MLLYLTAFIFVRAYVRFETILPNLYCPLSHSMLCPTHHYPFLYTFNPLSPSSLSPILLSPPSPRLQEMECAFIDGFGPEMLKTAAAAEDFLLVNGGSHAVSGDDLFVDELLDFSNDFEEQGEEQQQPQQQLDEPEEKEQDRKTACSVLQEMLTPPAPENSVVSANDEFGSLPESELSVPAEGLESLEWLSHFVEDSFSDYSLTGKLPPKPSEKRAEKEAAASEQPCFATPVLTKARTKRARTGVRIWPVLSPSFTESSTSSSSSSSSTTSFSPPNPWLVQSQTGESFLGKLAAKKQKKKLADGSSCQPRRCSHCGMTKTPQWRAGPLGSKTLCNACGVRYKSGRLLPEYRPACSPTFSIEMHSNNHRKVLEMRRKKESETEAAGPVPIFEDSNR